MGRVELRSIVWIVGTAVYQVQRVRESSDQKVEAENLGGMTTAPPERRVERKALCVGGREEE